MAIYISISFYYLLASNLLGIISQFLLFLLWPHFGQIIKLSLSFITFRVSHFPVSHLTYETVKLGLQNTLNMSKTTRVYFGVLHFVYKNGVWFKILFLDVVSGNMENVSGEWVILLIPIMKF